MVEIVLTGAGSVQQKKGRFALLNAYRHKKWNAIADSNIATADRKSELVGRADSHESTNDTATLLREYQGLPPSEAFELFDVKENRLSLALLARDIAEALGTTSSQKKKTHDLAGSRYPYFDWNLFVDTFDGGRAAQQEQRGVHVPTVDEYRDIFHVLGLEPDRVPQDATRNNSRQRYMWEPSRGWTPYEDRQDGGVELRLSFHRERTVSTGEAKYYTGHLSARLHQYDSD